MSTRGIFITATDTGAGKTFFASALLTALRREGFDACGFKPFCCGDRGDAEILASASGCSLDSVNPFWYRTPAAPMAAAFIENRPPDLDLVRSVFEEAATSEFVVVEGAGGWFVPICNNYFMADLACDFGLPVVLVAPNRLGVLNHALLTLEAIRRCGCPFLGWVLNELSPAYNDAARATNPALLEEILGSPPLLHLPFAAAQIPLPEPVRSLLTLRRPAR